MRKEVNSIAGRLSLRAPQRRSLEILGRLVDIAPPGKNADLKAALSAVAGEFPSVKDFEREFISVCFALATGVGKTRLMGAFITYLYTAHGVKNFFVLAPNLTIYDKLITDFTPNTPKYVFQGIAEFATDRPEIITGETYDQALLNQNAPCNINIFNISKINSEVRGGKSPRIKRLSEYIGDSYFAYLAGLPDLVLIMDESHRYRASAGVKAINELKPILGLELTATPQVETASKTVRFNNVIYDYPLGSAIRDGFVKDPAVATRLNFKGDGMTDQALEQLKLEDGVRLHEMTKVELETYGRSNGVPVVKPFMLVIARDTSHAAKLVGDIESDQFFEGRYKGKVIQVDSSQSGAAEEEMVRRLLKVEHPDEPTEIVVHVNMLKEGWDVTNLYTIVPLRAANARTLIEQSIGRGLRLPYGRRTGVPAVDRLSIVSHDKFQEIVDEARKLDSPIRMTTIDLDSEEFTAKHSSVVVESVFDQALDAPATPTGGALEDWRVPRQDVPVFSNPVERSVAQTVRDVIVRMSARPGEVPTASYLTRPDVLARIVRETRAVMPPEQLSFEGVETVPDIEQIAQGVCDLFVQQTMEIPRILVIPKGVVRSGYRPFRLDLAGLKLQAPNPDLWVQYLQSGRGERVAVGGGGVAEPRLESILVQRLIDFDDIAYEPNAAVLNDLGAQVVAHLRSYLPEADVVKVLKFHERQIAEFVRAQMAAHYFEEADEGYDVTVSRGFEPLKAGIYSLYGGEKVRDFRIAPANKSNMGRYLFGHFTRCLYDLQKFDSDPERQMAVILDRDAIRWFRPVKDQFRIEYRVGGTVTPYQPDFAAEYADVNWLIEVKAANQMTSPDVLAKKAAGELWCDRASAHAAAFGGKPWRYALIPHDAIAENMTIEGLT